MNSVPKLDPMEQHFFIPSSIAGLKLFLRYLPPSNTSAHTDKTVLYVHGGTFPSALSIAHRFHGRSWRDELADAGYHVWGLDFQGFGASDPYPQMREAVGNKAALGQTDTTSEQLAQAVHFICKHQNISRISIIAHSWGSIVAGLFAGRYPEHIERLVFFAPIAWREKQEEPTIYPAWRLISLHDQWKRFTQEVPAGEPAVLNRQEFEQWGELYLDTDAESRTRSPAAVKIPGGPWQDIALAGAGQLAYDPTNVRAPVCIIRGEWDAMSSAADAAWLFDALKNSPQKREVKISRATHLMHLEESRFALYRETETFLNGNDPVN